MNVTPDSPLLSMDTLVVCASFTGYISINVLDALTATLLIADGEHIVWIPGRRMSRAYQVGSITKKILEIKITEEKGNGRDDQGFDPRGES